MKQTAASSLLQTEAWAFVVCYIHGRFSQVPKGMWFICHTSLFLYEPFMYIICGWPKMKQCWYIILLMVMVLSGCADDKRIVGLLDHAEAVMEEHPDSAYQFLCEADSWRRTNSTYLCHPIHSFRKWWITTMTTAPPISS